MDFALSWGRQRRLAKTQLLFQAAQSLLIEEKRSNYKPTNELPPENNSKNSLQPLLFLNCDFLDANAKKCISTYFTDLR